MHPHAVRGFVAGKLFAQCLEQIGVRRNVQCEFDAVAAVFLGAPGQHEHQAGERNGLGKLCEVGHESSLL